MRIAVLAVAPALGVALALAPTPAHAAPAPPAHPLGNFSINQYLGLVLHPDRVEATAVVDSAEIPTLQERSLVDADSDGSPSDAERRAYAARTCQEVAAAISVRLRGDSLQWTVTSPTFAYAPGVGGLSTSRLSCGLTAPADLGRAGRLEVSATFLADRVGWREITARGDGVRLLESSAPDRSVSGELRAYPEDLLASALDVRNATLRVEPGTAGTPPPSAAAGSRATTPTGADPVTRWMATVDRQFQRLAGGPQITPVVGLLAVLLSLLLGAGHAALPGHGKTVLAAYLAGQRGRPRDAVAVGATVTFAHTAGVLAIGLLLASGTALAGETLLRWLGLLSGVVVVAVGGGMLASVLSARHRSAHSHSHDHDHAHDHGHDHARGPGHYHHEPGRGGRLGLAGIGLAGGLVPSPSALVVLLGAIGLGRTWFGVLLVITYGVGMAATLTAAGLLLVAAQRRLARTPHDRGPLAWLARKAGPVTTRLPDVTRTTTAALVVVVGFGLAARAAVGL